MGFLVPGFLAGLALAAIPFIIHLIYRRKAPQVVFAAARFLKVAARRTARRRRLDNLLLLLLRTALIALLALGLAGPIIRRAIGSGRAGSDVVIIIDNSLSMSAVDNSSPRFARAKEAFQNILSTLDSSDLVAVVAVAPPESRDLTGLASDVAAVRTWIARLSVSSARGSLPAALERAAAVLAGSTASSKLLYIISDFQANSVPSASTLSDDARAALLAVPVIAYDCSNSEPRNLSVDGLSIIARGAVVGSPIEVAARVSSNSPAAETVSVVLTAAGRRVQSRTISIPARGSAGVTLTMLAADPGILDGAAEIDTSDALAADNRRPFSLVVRARIKALVIEKTSSAVPYDDDAFFLRRALDPFFANPVARSPFDVSIATYAADPALSGCDIVFLVLRPGVGDALSASLSRYVAAGGNLIVFVSDPGSSPLEAPWLSARLLSQRSASVPEGEAFSITALDTTAPALAAFKNEPAALYNTIRVYQYCLADPASGASVIARFDTGDPCIIQSPAPSRVTLFTLAPVRGASTFAASQFFLPLVHELSYSLLASSSGTGEVLAGTRAVLASPDVYPSGLVVTSPDGSARLLQAPTGRPIECDDPDLLGTWRVRLADAAFDSFAFSVAADPAESGLTRLSVSDIKSRLPGSPVLVATSADTLSEALASLKPVLALGDVLLYAVLAVALFECLTANRLPGKQAHRK